MPRDSNGDYSIPNVFVPNTVIASAAVNANFADVAEALTNSLDRTGEGALETNLKMDDHKIVDLAAATARTDGLAAGQAADGGITWYGNLSGTDAYTVSENDFTPAAYVNGMQIRARVVNANATMTPTLQVGALGAKTIVNGNGSALQIGALAVGSILTLVYSSDTDALHLQGQTIDTSNFEVIGHLAGISSNGGDHNLVGADAGTLVRQTSASANTLTIDTDATGGYSGDMWVSVQQVGAGITTITTAVGVTLNGQSPGSVEMPSQWATATLVRVGANEWTVNLEGVT